VSPPRLPDDLEEAAFRADRDEERAPSVEDTATNQAEAVERSKQERGSNGRFRKAGAPEDEPRPTVDAESEMERLRVELEAVTGSPYLAARWTKTIETAKGGARVTVLREVTELLMASRQKAQRDEGVEIRVVFATSPQIALGRVFDDDLAAFVTFAASCVNDPGRARGELARLLARAAGEEVTRAAAPTQPAPAARLKALDDEPDEEQPTPPPRGVERPGEPEDAPPPAPVHVSDFGFTPRTSEVDVSGTDTLRRMNDLWRRR
jgi:hypothetical protein